MKYLMMDTNIYLDMVVSRNGSHKANSYDQLMKLLNYGEIKLVVPKIVITEVFRHIDKEIDKIGYSINKIKSRTNDLYWINHVEELETFNKNLKPVKSGINALLTEFNKNKDKYKLEYAELFNKLFYNGNSIILGENEDIVFKATQRKVHKIMPFHYGEKDDNKDSMPDSIIIETLINIEALIKLNIGDKIYFISRNTVDFSDNDDINLLHKDITTDLELKGLIDRVNYRLLFTKMLLEDFKDEIESAGITEQVEVEAEYERTEAIAESYQVQDDSERESVGLSSLSSDYEDKLWDLDEIRALMDLLEEMKNDIQSKCEEFSQAYYDLEECIRDKSLVELEKVIGNNDLMQVMIGQYKDEEDIKDEVMSFVEWVIGDEEHAKFGENFKNEDYFSLNNTLVTFYDSYNNEYKIETEGYINPSSDDEDSVYIRFYKANSLLEEGKISIYYGFININDDGNVGDGAEEEIGVSIDKIIDKLLEVKDAIISELDNRILKSKQFFEIIE
ncbi:PIN domain-containing protein [Clostridium sp. FP2]|uniref:PIN domain-containing protein n=1 Tax=Clostridium sp. FP2 TaxID=2724481 RepID=UPI0013E94695|nr:PIN domain-containing protein [Clostridium sp. FP2]MBZ9624728.1 PIN domain-containing protein [Clostridium sp. FP2]